MNARFPPSSRYGPGNSTFPPIGVGLFIASGMHGEKLWSDGAMDMAKVSAALEGEGVQATYVMPGLT